jgi:hypothetical protein
LERYQHVAPFQSAVEAGRRILQQHPRHVHTFTAAHSENSTMLLSAAFACFFIAPISLLPTAAVTAASQGLPLLMRSW